MRLSRFVLMLSTVAPPLTAQSSAPVEIGSRVRMRDGVSDFSLWTVGTVSARQGDTVRIRPAGGGAEQVFRFGGSTTLFVSMGRKASTGQGAILGGVGGLIGGAILGFATGHDCAPGAFVCFDRSSTAAIGSLAGGVIGAVVGALIGAATKHDVWGPVVSTAHGRFGLGLSARFSSGRRA